ncbi:MAG: ABC transporter substrate-binding protein [Rhodobacteraceae bacterium]|jgi:polar amino acid transport system substrate-binding protein|nr:ABC transporter substrate-binding protein [Paracoccaceae bacterium]
MFRHITATATAAVALLAALPALAQELPARIAEAGGLNVGIERDHPPMEFIDPVTGELVGFDVDLITAVAAELGTELKFVHSRFEGLIPNLQSNRIDLVISGMYDTPVRRENSIDFIDYLSAGAVFYTLDANADIQEPLDICGRVVSANRGTSYPETVTKWSDENCIPAGLDPIAVITDTDMATEFLYLKTGRADASLQGTEAIPTVLASEEGPFRTIGGPFTNVMVGIGFRADDSETRDAVFAALQKVFEKGVYAELIGKWGLEASALAAPTINQGEAP